MESGGDRLSRLGDGVLGHILSFLPAAEAARAAALSRRWRHVFASVHTLSFVEPAGGPGTAADDCDDGDDASSVWSSDYCHGNDSPAAAPAPPFAAAVCSALLGRNRRARVAVGAPLRGLRVRFDEFSGAASAKGVDALVTYAVHDAGDQLRLVDLRLGRGPICNRDYSLRRRGDSGGARATSPPPAPEPNGYVAPASLLNCAALRTLRLGPCRLRLPSAVALPSLDTLQLVRVTAAATAIQQLVSACPRLADLSLKACPDLTALSVLHARLRALALKCCHGLAAVAVESSELRTFKYRGAVPEQHTFLTMHGPRRVSSCKLDFCGDDASDDPAELARLAGFLELFSSTKYLHIKAARIGCGICHDVFSSVPGFPSLRHLELTGMVPDADTDVVAAVTRVLQWSPSLEVLSLFFMPEPVEIPEESSTYHSEKKMIDTHNLRYQYVELPVSEGSTIPCLSEQTREINFVHYQGAMAQRMLAKFLLRNAPVVEEVCCEFAQGPLWIQTQLMEEIKGWARNKSANMMFF